jgi:hypothetical protein
MKHTACLLIILVLAGCSGRQDARKTAESPLPARVLCKETFTDSLKWVPGTGKLAGITEADRTIKTVDAVTGTVKPVVKFTSKSVNDIYQKLNVTSDGTRIIYKDGGKCFIADLRSGEKKEVPLEDRPYYIFLSNDDREIAYSCSKGLIIASLYGSKSRTVLKEPVIFLRWSPDGAKLGFVKTSGPGLWTMNTDGNGLKRIEYNAIGFLWFPDGRRAALARQTEICIIDTKTLEEKKIGEFTTRPNPAKASFSTWLSLSPGGEKLAYDFGTLEKDKVETGKEQEYSQVNSDIYIYDVTAGTTSNITCTEKEWELYPEFSPDGSKLLCYTRKSENGKIRLTPMIIDLQQ